MKVWNIQEDLKHAREVEWISKIHVFVYRCLRKKIETCKRGWTDTHVFSSGAQNNIWNMQHLKWISRTHMFVSGKQIKIWNVQKVVMISRTKWHKMNIWNMREVEWASKIHVFISGIRSVCLNTDVWHTHKWRSEICKELNKYHGSMYEEQNWRSQICQRGWKYIKNPCTYMHIW